MPYQLPAPMVCETNRLAVRACVGTGFGLSRFRRQFGDLRRREIGDRAERVAVIVELQEPALGALQAVQRPSVFASTTRPQPPRHVPYCSPAMNLGAAAFPTAPGRLP